MRLVLDASVAVAAQRPAEPSHAAAHARVLRVLTEADTIVVPALFIVEVRAALARLGFDSTKAGLFVETLTQEPHEVVTIGPRAARSAATIAARRKLRGADSLYVWLARREGIPLCTLDSEMAIRGKAACTMLEP